GVTPLIFPLVFGSLKWRSREKDIAFFLSFLDMTPSIYSMWDRMAFTNDFGDKKGKIHANLQ
ncbi:hypothetical protein KKD61_01320, partial [Patescibacteria group bacterium]|nr:hypothetical protein [Patescibacteria group bacterium]